MKRVFIVHGWGGGPSDHWYPWLKKELTKKGFAVKAPAMPDTDAPAIDAWVGALQKAVGTLDTETYFVGHSIGCQTILRYLQTQRVRAAGIVLVAPWTTLFPDSTPTLEDKAIAAPWMNTPLQPITAPTIAIFSDNDEDVPLENVKTFKKLGAKIVHDDGKGHFTADEGVKKLPSALDAVLSLTP